jgi:hypothetical protein
MAARSFDGVTLTGTHYTLTAPANGTVQNLIDSAVKQTWNKFDLRGLYHQGRKLEATTKLANLSSLHNGDKIAMVPKMGRMGMNPNNMRAAKETLEIFLSQQPRGGKRKTRKSKKSKRQTRRRR